MCRAMLLVLPLLLGHASATSCEGEGAACNMSLEDYSLDLEASLSLLQRSALNLSVHEQAKAPGRCVAGVLDKLGLRGSPPGETNRYDTREACRQACLGRGAHGFSYYTNGGNYNECRCGSSAKTFDQLVEGEPGIKNHLTTHTCKANDQSTFDWCTCEADKPLPQQFQEATPWRPAALASAMIVENQMCTNHVDFRAVGAWRHEQNGSSVVEGTLARCASLVDERGASFGCTSGVFHFAKRSIGRYGSNCGCATDACDTSQRIASPDWDVHILSMDIIDAQRTAHFPMAPVVGHKIWNTVPPSSIPYKVAKHDCDSGYRPITELQECKDAGNALNIQPWPHEHLPRLNAFATWVFRIPVVLYPQALPLLNASVFYHGCLVAPGANRGAKKAFVDFDALWFNTDPAGRQLDHETVFVKHRICAKA